MRLLLSLLLGLLSCAVRAEAPQEFANRLRAAHMSVTVTVNVRDDQTTFGSLTIGVPPKVLADHESVGKLLQDVGRYAGAKSLRVIVVARKPDVEAFAAKLKEAGAPAVSMQVMADSAGNQSARLFVLPGEAAKQ